MTHLEHVRRLIEMGYLNQLVNDTELDKEKASDALETAIQLDYPGEWIG